MKEKNELIDVIVDKLKKVHEPSYREGSWEKFKTKQGLKPAVYTLHKTWYVAASVVFLLGFGLFWMVNNEQDPVVGLSSEKNTYVNNLPHNEDVSARKNATDVVEIDLADKKAPSLSEHIMEVPEEVKFVSQKAHTLVLPQLDGETHVQVSKNVYIPELAYLTSKQINIQQEEQIQSRSKIQFSDHVLASQSMVGIAANDAVAHTQYKKIRINERFNLGLFVSPYATGQKMNVGGGLLIGYQLHNMISVRTGISYNNYEVQTLKNPVEAASMEAVQAEANVSMAQDAAAKTSLYQHRMIIPNINAVSGFVRSLDIPIDVKFNAGRVFYATAGVSYSAILNQERNAHYVENLNMETFAKGYPSNSEEAHQAVKPVTKTIESTEQNVNTNGFSGFVNFSLGREVRLNKKMGVSVEPYLKIPVGQYRRADMDYTNGGIRIMTNF